MKLRVAIDWLNFTASWTKNKLPREHAYPVLCQFSQVKALHGYREAIQNTLGTRIMWNDDRRDMGVHVMYSGGTLNAHLDNGITAQQIAAFHRENGDSCRRIDVAIDVIDGKLDIKAHYELIDHGYNLPNKRKSTLMQSGSGVTMYIGSRTSDLFMRVYDKGAERGTDDNWKRVEIEVKGNRAMFFCNMLVNEDQLAVGETARQVIKGMADFPTMAWQKIVGDEPLTLTKGENRDKDTRRWLLEQVAPAMGRYLAASGDDDLIEAFMGIVNIWRESDTRANG